MTKESTTVEVTRSLWIEAKVAAARAEKSLKAWLGEAIREKLNSKPKRP